MHVATIKIVLPIVNIYVDRRKEVVKLELSDLT